MKGLAGRLISFLGLFVVAILVLLFFVRVIPGPALQSEINKGYALTRLLLRSIENSSISLRKFDELMAERLLSSTRMLARTPVLSDELLTTAAHLNRWLEVEYINSSFKVLVSTLGYTKPLLAIDSLRSFIKSSIPEKAMLLGEDTLAVLVKRPDGNIIVVYADLAPLSASKSKVGIGQTIRKLGESESIKYVAFQTKEGIIYAYPEEISLTSILSDRFLQDALKSERIIYRMSSFKGYRVLEFVAPTQTIEMEKGIIRIGLDLNNFISTTKRLRIIGLGLFGLIIVLGFLMFRFYQARIKFDLQKLTRYQTFDSLPVGVIELDRNGNVVFANSRAYTILGKEITRLVKENDRFRVFESIRSGKELSGQVNLQGKSIIYTTFKIPEGYALIIEDRTAHERIERELSEAQELKTITNIISGLVHEIRSPLNALSILIQGLILKGNLNPEQRSSVENALKQIGRIEESIRRLLTIAKPVKTVKQSVNVRKLVDEVCDEFSKKTKTQGKTFNCSIGIAEDFTMSLDPRGLKVALENILTNALDATEPEDVITLKVYRYTQYVVFELHDTGKGIPEDNLSVIFEPHYSTKPGGLGIGLYQTKRVIESLGGKIDVTSKPNEGTVFKIFLPYEDFDS